MMGKPVLSLKQFMLRTEILKLYRGYMRLGRFLDEPPPTDDKSTETPMRNEWTHWVRSEFRLRQDVTTDEEMTRALLVHGKRQLQELERTIMLATNRNSPDNKNISISSSSSSTSCKNKTESASDNSQKNEKNS